MTWFGRLRANARKAYLSAMPHRDLARFVISPAAIPISEKTQSELHRLYYTNTGPRAQKWRHYFEIYERHLSGFRDSSFRMLEIGVFEGGSLALWRKYFGPAAVLFGIDIDPECGRFDKLDGRVRIGSQDDPVFLRSVVSEMGGVDVVLDDGSHIAAHQRASFEVLFPLLSEGGLYLCEDTHTAYWRFKYQGGLRRRGTFVEYAKQLIDDLHADFHGHVPSVPDAYRLIHGIHFYNSIVVIEKRKQDRPAYTQVGTPR